MPKPNPGSNHLEAAQFEDVQDIAAANRDKAHVMEQSAIQ